MESEDNKRVQLAYLRGDRACEDIRFGKQMVTYWINEIQSLSDYHTSNGIFNLRTEQRDQLH